jgi:hypothetical protein
MYLVFGGHHLGTNYTIWGTGRNLACISLGVDSWPSTETGDFLLESNELISLTVLNENFNSSNS